MSEGSFELPSVSTLKNALSEASTLSASIEREYVRNFNSKSVASQEKYARLKGLQDHYKHKGRWSGFLMLLMAGMIGFQSWLLVEVGRGNWDFTAYDWLLPALLAQNLAQVVGLAVFVVRSLFSDPESVEPERPVSSKDD